MCRAPGKGPDPREARHLGGVGPIDAAATDALALYGADASRAAGGELIAHGRALIIPIAPGAVAFALLPREIDRPRTARRPAAPAPVVAPETSTRQ
jgi:hypothetical protein